MKVSDAFVIRAGKQEVWNVFQDIGKLAAWMPGVRSMMPVADLEYEADMEVKTPFMTVAFKANGRIKESVPGEEMLVEITGTPLKLAGLFKAKLRVGFRELEPDRTEIRYDMDLQMTGRLASLGDVLMKGVVVKSAGEFARNVQNYFESHKMTAG